MTGSTVSGAVPSGRPRLRLEARDQPGLLTHVAVSLLLLLVKLLLRLLQRLELLPDFLQDHLLCMELTLAGMP